RRGRPARAHLPGLVGAVPPAGRRDGPAPGGSARRPGLRRLNLRNCGHHQSEGALTIVTTVSSGAAVAADAVIPAPVDLEPGEGVLGLAAVTLHAPDAVTARLAGELLAEAGAVVGGPAGTAPATVTLVTDPAAGPAGSDNPERYTLTVTTDGVTVAAPGRAGLLHGVRTLRQLVNARRGRPGGAVEAGAVVVRDEPRYAWRGLSLDVVRHWFGPDDLRAVVDLVGRSEEHTSELQSRENLVCRLL